MDDSDAIALTDPAVVPGPEELERVLGASHPAWLELLEMLGRNGLTHGWRYYRDGGAWLCKVTSKRKTVIWMSARQGFVRGVVYVPERCVAEVLACGIGPATIARIRTTPNVGTSRPCTVDVRGTEDVAELEKLTRCRQSLR